MSLAWDSLLCGERRKPKSKEGYSATGGGRVELERDYDRILFAAPTRRLADKTQVFPLDRNDSVRTRLTHSHEVANLARSIGVRLAFEHSESVFSDSGELLQVTRGVPALLAAIGLAHDLGNPPFGHQGEKAIRQWFTEKDNTISLSMVLDSENCPIEEKEDASETKLKVHADFLNFDGNAQTFRLLTRLQVLNDDYGLNLTYATLASLLKYPVFHDSNFQERYKKFGIFESEREIATEILEKVGLPSGYRHPLVFIMEACDDIAYSVLDAEDTVKKGYASFYDLIDYLDHKSKGDEVIDWVIKKASEENEGYKKVEGLSSNEVNDISMQMFRVYAIFQMAQATCDSFINHIDQMMTLSLPDGFELIKSSKAAKLCEVLKSFDKRYGFSNKDVLKLELEGSNYIKSLMDMLWSAISKEDGNKVFNDYAYNRISENYRRVYDKAITGVADSNQIFYSRCQLLCDAISGMTDSYAIALHNELRPLYDGFRS